MIFLLFVLQCCYSHILKTDTDVTDSTLQVHWATVHTPASKIAYGVFAIITTLLLFTLMLTLTKKRYATTWAKTLGQTRLTKIHTVSF